MSRIPSGACVVFALTFAAATGLATSGCERERRTLDPGASLGAPARGARVSALHPGPADSVPGPYGAGAHGTPSAETEQNAYDLSEGKRLFAAYNCTGCHANGGGGMGPPLIDRAWLYGSGPRDVYASIVEGRPNGMPAFGDRIPVYQVRQLAAYVRSISGLAPQFTAPSRNDDMDANPPENSIDPRRPLPPAKATPATAVAR